MKKILLITITTLIFLPSITFAQKYLVDLGVDLENKDSFNEYINLLYVTSISVAALLAVVKIVVAGAKYMLSDIVTKKNEAKTDIRGALLGLLLIIGAVIILNTINPALTDGGLNITEIVVPKLSITAPVAPASGSSEALTPSKNPDGTTKVGIVQSGQQISDYPAIQPGFWNTNGNIVTVNFDAQCQAQVNAGTTGISGSKQYQYDACVSKVKSAVISYCSDNYGVNTPGGTSIVCKLPTAIKEWDTFTAEFEAYKATLPVNDYAGREATQPSNQVMQDVICPGWGGVYVRNNVYKNVCVKYN